MSVNTNNVLSVILGGGVGSRLYPLTQQRSKPAVPLAGKYRLVDIPISNCINSGLRRVYILTQFNSASLHRHISQSYKFDQFSGGFVEILAAQQTLSDSSWYQGTADAVRKNLIHLLNHSGEHILVLSGDQLYRMDFRLILQQHVDTGADITIATLPVRRDLAQGLGIMQIDADRRITRFVEKPKDPAVLDTLHLDPHWYGRLGIQGEDEFLLASMGIYVFNRQVLVKLLETEEADFGKHIIPGAISQQRVFSYIFQGYWEDIGTIRSFFDAHMKLVQPDPPFPLYEPGWPIYTHARNLPPARVIESDIRNSLLAEGANVLGADIEDSIIGVRSVVRRGTHLRQVVMTGADYYEGEEPMHHLEAAPDDAPRMGIGHGCSLTRVIVDKNCRIGDNVIITAKPDDAEFEGSCWWVRDGITVIPKGTVIPSGTRI